MSDQVREVYSLMIPIINDNILLPNATVAEIVPFADVTPEESGPKWYIGQLHWRAQEIPMISLDILNGGEDPQANRRARVAVVSTLNNNVEMPYIAIVVQGIPRLTHVTEPSISLVDEAQIGIADKARVKIGSIQATVPDIDKLESLIMEIKVA